MIKHEIKICPRCATTFECKLNKPIHCQCARVELAEDRLLALADHYTDCLCLACLREVATGSPLARPGPR